MPKEKETILYMLKLFKEMPFLWDSNNNDYKNKVVRDGGKNVLLEVYKRLEPDATIPSLMKKIQNLRTNYLKECRKVRMSLATAVGSDQIYVPTLYYFDAFQFLEGVSDSSTANSEPSPTMSLDPLLTWKTRYQASSDEEDGHSRLFIDIPPQISLSQDNTTTKKQSIKSEPTNTSKKRRIFDVGDDNYDDDGDVEKHALKEKWEVIGKAIGLQLRDLDKKQRIIAHKMINEVLYYAETEMLSTESYVTL